MKITKEDVLKIEHEIIDEDDDIWSMSDEIRIDGEWVHFEDVEEYLESEVEEDG